MKELIQPEAIRSKAFELGWDDIAFTTPEIPQKDVDSYHAWLNMGFHAGLAYMENQIRTDPQQILPGAKTAILFVTNYKQPRYPFRSNGEGLIASYARNRDYHNVHRRRLKKMIRWMEELTGEKDIARGFSDSKPIMEKALFVKAGLGWLGKNTLLIHRRFGTFILLSGILTTLDLAHPEPKEGHIPKCGVCTRCLDACPTGALKAPYILNAAQCLSYHLIEKEGPVDNEIAKKNPGYAFGCDICQDVCPHNVRSPLSQSADFTPDSAENAYISIEKLQTMTNLDGTPLKRKGLEGLSMNLQSLPLF